MSRCIFCNSALRDDVRFCVRCGKPVKNLPSGNRIDVKIADAGLQGESNIAIPNVVARNTSIPVNHNQAQGKQIPSESDMSNWSEDDDYTTMISLIHHNQNFGRQSTLMTNITDEDTKE